MSLYETLGVARDATAAQIRKAYRAMAKQHHPDTGEGKTYNENGNKGWIIP
jgi:molecular chaperone DnaJ